VDTIDSVEKSSFLDRKRRGGKSIWEWMQVFIVPFAIALFTVVFSVVQSCSQRQIEDQRAQDAALQAYLDQMSTLLMERDLRASKEGSEVRILARARTLTVLERLDTSRKAEVMQFLLEASLLQTDTRNAPLANLPEGPLPIIKLGDPYARTGENGVDLSGVDLSGANLSQANLDNANLSNSDLSGTNLRSARLKDAALHQTNLRGANLTDADLRNAYLGDAIGVTVGQLEREARSLKGATMPDGSKHP
jgi:Pentapeptide repeats (8 copies)